jgi:hypothetical protein
MPRNRGRYRGAAADPSGSRPDGGGTDQSQTSEKLDANSLQQTNQEDKSNKSKSTHRDEPQARPAEATTEVSDEAAGKKSKDESGDDAARLPLAPPASAPNPELGRPEDLPAPPPQAAEPEEEEPELPDVHFKGYSRMNILTPSWTREVKTHDMFDFTLTDVHGPVADLIPDNVTPYPHPRSIDRIEFRHSIGFYKGLMIPRPPTSSHTLSDKGNHCLDNVLKDVHAFERMYGDARTSRLMVVRGQTSPFVASGVRLPIGAVVRKTRQSKNALGDTFTTTTAKHIPTLAEPYRIGAIMQCFEALERRLITKSEMDLLLSATWGSRATTIEGTRDGHIDEAKNEITLVRSICHKESQIPGFHGIIRDYESAFFRTHPEFARHYYEESYARGIALCSDFIQKVDSEIISEHRVDIKLNHAINTALAPEHGVNFAKQIAAFLGAGKNHLLEVDFDIGSDASVRELQPLLAVGLMAITDKNWMTPDTRFNAFRSIISKFAPDPNAHILLYEALIRFLSQPVIPPITHLLPIHAAFMAQLNTMTLVGRKGQPPPAVNNADVTRIIRFLVDLFTNDRGRQTYVPNAQIQNHQRLNNILQTCFPPGRSVLTLFRDAHGVTRPADQTRTFINTAQVGLVSFDNIATKSQNLGDDSAARADIARIYRDYLTLLEKVAGGVTKTMQTAFNRVITNNEMGFSSSLIALRSALLLNVESSRPFSPDANLRIQDAIKVKVNLQGPMSLILNGVKTPNTKGTFIPPTALIPKIDYLGISPCEALFYARIAWTDLHARVGVTRMDRKIERVAKYFGKFMSSILKCADPIDYEALAHTFHNDYFRDSRDAVLRRYVYRPGVALTYDLRDYALFNDLMSRNEHASYGQDKTAGQRDETELLMPYRAGRLSDYVSSAMISQEELCPYNTRSFFGNSDTRISTGLLTRSDGGLVGVTHYVTSTSYRTTGVDLAMAWGIVAQADPSYYDGTVRAIAADATGADIAVLRQFIQKYMASTIELESISSDNLTKIMSLMNENDVKVKFDTYKAGNAPIDPAAFVTALGPVEKINGIIVRAPIKVELLDVSSEIDGPFDVGDSFNIDVSTNSVGDKWVLEMSGSIKVPVCNGPIKHVYANASLIRDVQDRVTANMAYNCHSVNAATLPGFDHVRAQGYGRELRPIGNSYLSMVSYLKEDADTNETPVDANYALSTNKGVYHFKMTDHMPLKCCIRDFLTSRILNFRHASTDVPGYLYLEDNSPYRDFDTNVVSLVHICSSHIKLVDVEIDVSDLFVS